MARKQDLFNLILRAAKDNDADTMNMLIASDPSTAKQANGIGQTGLHVAALWGNFEVAMMLIDAGANINAKNQFGVTPLASAVPNDHITMVQLLLDERADPQIRSANGVLPSEVAKSAGMRALLGAPPLKGHEAVISSDISALEELLMSIDVSDQDSDGDTMLHLAVKAATGKSVSGEVVKEGDEVQMRVRGSTTLDVLLANDTATGFVTAQRLHNREGEMPLHIAASDGNVAVCEGLLQAKHPAGLVNAVALKKGGLHNGQWGRKNADGELERLPSEGSTALHMVVQLLHDAKEEAEDAEEEDPNAGDVRLVRLLLWHGANPNSLDGEMQTPLHIAIMGGLHEVAQLLCEANADLSLGCKAFGMGNTALHQATILRDLATIRMLAAHGADVDAPGRDGWTPLGLAVRSNAVDAAKLLLEAKASPHAASGNGKTPIEVASINGKAGLVELLQAAKI